jgi:hypothetical protein
MLLPRFVLHGSADVTRESSQGNTVEEFVQAAAPNTFFDWLTGLIDGCGTFIFRHIMMMYMYPFTYHSCCTRPFVQAFTCGPQGWQLVALGAAAAAEEEGEKRSKSMLAIPKRASAMATSLRGRANNGMGSEGGTR